MKTTKICMIIVAGALIAGGAGWAGVHHVQQVKMERAMELAKVAAHKAQAKADYELASQLADILAGLKLGRCSMKWADESDAASSTSERNAILAAAKNERAAINAEYESAKQNQQHLQAYINEALKQGAAVAK